MSRSSLLFLVLAAIVAAVCVRLGFWQLGRLEERRTANALVSSRLDSAAVAAARLPADPRQAQYRRVFVEGLFDYDNEVVLTGRARQGSPGVHLLTPLRVSGSDTAVLVDRGWVYAPDAATVDPALWREADRVRVEGVVGLLRAPEERAAAVPERLRTLRRADAAALDTLLPYPFVRYYVSATEITPEVLPASGALLGRSEPPPLDEGSHLSYAFQWFTFAVIALGGAGVMIFSTRRPRDDNLVVPPPPPLRHH